MPGLAVNKGFTRRNPDGRYRIPGRVLGEFRMLEANGEIAIYGDCVDALGEWEALGVSIEEVKLLLRQHAAIKKKR